MFAYERTKHKKKNDDPFLGRRTAFFTLHPDRIPQENTAGTPSYFSPVGVGPIKNQAIFAAMCPRKSCEDCDSNGKVLQDLYLA